MSNALALIRSLIIYSLCLPLAILIGYRVAMPMDTQSLTTVVVAVALPLIPLLLKYHHAMLFACWNTSMVLFFLPGRPHLYLVMALISLGLSTLQHILNRNIRFLYVPSVARPLILLAIVVIVTAQLTGGFGSRLLGGDVYGGRSYVTILLAIVGYFALCCYPVPAGKAKIYFALYMLGAITATIGNLAPYVDSKFYFLFALFPVENLNFLEGLETQRLGGVTLAAMGIGLYFLARHGFQGLFDFRERWSLSPIRFRGGLGLNNPWRIIIFVALIGLSLMGGYRSTAVVLALVFMIQFYLEGLFRTRLFPALVLLGLLMAAVSVPMIDKMPLMVQRSLSFLPFLEIDPIAKYAAQSSTEWRLEIWRQVLPMVPDYLLLGKGYSINPGELNLSVDIGHTAYDSGQTAILAGDYHNGPLSLLIPLGIFGMIAFLWFLYAGFRVLLNNYRNGAPELHSINTFVLAYFLGKAIFFFTIFGSFYVDLMVFTGLVGLSVSLNGGVREPATETVEKPAFTPFKLARAGR
jgi:O-antigen ligase